MLYLTEYQSLTPHSSTPTGKVGYILSNLAHDWAESLRLLCAVGAMRLGSRVRARAYAPSRGDNMLIISEKHENGCSKSEAAEKPL